MVSLVADHGLPFTSHKNAGSFHSTALLLESVLHTVPLSVEEVSPLEGTVDFHQPSDHSEWTQAQTREKCQG